MEIGGIGVTNDSLWVRTSDGSIPVINEYGADQTYGGYEDMGDYAEGWVRYNFWDDITAVNRLFVDNLSIVEVVLPESIVRIDNEAFKGCKNLSKINIPASCYQIGSEAFSGCESLGEVSMEHVQYIYPRAFANCYGLVSVDFGESLVEIRDEAFICEGASSRLTSLSFPATLTDIGSYAFSGQTTVSDLYFYSESVPYIKDSSFAGTVIRTVHCPDDLVSTYHGELFYREGFTNTQFKGLSSSFVNVTMTGDWVEYEPLTNSYLGVYTMEDRNVTIRWEGDGIDPQLCTINAIPMANFFELVVVSEQVTANSVQRTYQLPIIYGTADRQEFNPMNNTPAYVIEVYYDGMYQQVYGDFKYDFVLLFPDAIDVDTGIDNPEPPITVYKRIRGIRVPYFKASGSGEVNARLDSSYETARRMFTIRTSDSWFVKNGGYVDYIGTPMYVGDTHTTTIRVTNYLGLPLDGAKVKITLEGLNEIIGPQEDTFTISKDGYVNYGSYCDVTVTIKCVGLNHWAPDIVKVTYEDEFYQVYDNYDTKYHYPSNAFSLRCNGVFEVFFPDEVEEDVEYGYSVIYGDDATLTFDAPSEVVFLDSTIEDYANYTRIHKGTFMVDASYTEPTVDIMVSDGVKTITKTIRVIEKDSSMPTISINRYANLSFPQAGATRDITITYSNTAEQYINKPYSTVYGVSINQNSVTSSNNIVEISYSVVVPATTYKRDIPLIFSCSSAQGASCTETFTGMQEGIDNTGGGGGGGEGGGDSDPTRCYITLDSTAYTFPATGGTYIVKVYAGYPTEAGVSVRCANTNGVYPITWCKAEKTGGSVTETEGEYEYTITMNANTGTDPMSAHVTFSYTNVDGEKASKTFLAVLSAADGEPDIFDPEVQPYVSQLKLKANGFNDIQSITYVQVNYQDFQGQTINEPSVGAGWFRITGSEQVSDTVDGILMKYYWEADENTMTQPRSTKIRFSGYAAGVFYYADVQVVQAMAEGGGGGGTDPDNPDDPSNPSNPNIPTIDGVYIGQIWKDVEFDFGNMPSVAYTVWYGDELIFSGKSWKRPNSSNNKIMINKICQNYMIQQFLDLNSVAWEISNKDFTLRDADGVRVYSTYRFINDWSYSDDFKAGLLSHPILNRQRAVRGQMFPFSLFGAGEQVKVEYGVNYKDGYVDKYGNPIEDWYSTEYITNGVSTDFFRVAYRDAEYIEKVWIGDDVYTVEEPCVIPYVMYYLNPWGGFDWFPILGKVSMTDNLTHYQMQKNYLNTSIDFCKVRYLSEIDKTYQLNTGWLKQEESDRMWYLLQSNVVYLHDIKAGKIMPVLITDTTQEHKQKTPNNKIINYTFNVQLSQQRERI